MERYEQYRLFEEKTDIGERLSLPIENHLELEVVDGAVYGRDIQGRPRRMTDWAREAYESSQIDAAFSGANSVERLRRHYEYEEAVAVETLQVGQTMVVFSPIPDAAREGRLTIQGYRTDLARTFCRLYTRREHTVEAVTLSLEQSNKQALRDTAQQLGMKLPISMQSEDILKVRHLTTLTTDQVSQLPDTIRACYDLSLYHQTGEVFFAGNRLAGAQDSMRFINENHDIIDEHMAFLRAIESRLGNGRTRDEELEKLRQRTAAALDERLHGGQVVSIGDASVSDRLSTNDYGGECATGAQGAQEQMGLAQGKHTTNCPLCGMRGVTATVEGETITCSDCRGSVDICTGKVTPGKPKRSEPAQQVRRPKQFKQSLKPPHLSLEATYGQYMELRTIKTIGGAKTVVVHRYTGEIVEQR